MPNGRRRKGPAKIAAKNGKQKRKAETATVANVNKRRKPNERSNQEDLGDQGQSEPQNQIETRAKNNREAKDSKKKSANATVTRGQVHADHNEDPTVQQPQNDSQGTRVELQL